MMCPPRIYENICTFPSVLLSDLQVNDEAQPSHCILVFASSLLTFDMFFYEAAQDPNIFYDVLPWTSDG